MLRHGREVFIVESLRTPVGRGRLDVGWLAAVHPNVLLGAVYTALMERSGCLPEAIEDLIIGCTSQIGVQSRNIARNAWLQAGYSDRVPGVTLDRRCGSAQTAFALGSSLVASGMHELVIAGGVEHMGLVPIDAVRSTEAQFGTPWPPELRSRYDFVPQGESAELIADEWRLSRTELDQLAVDSHRRADESTRAGRFEREMVAIETADRLVSQDQGIRPGTDLETLRKLPPVFREDGRITAGTSSQISDGAAGMLLASETAVREYALKPIARVIDHVTVGVDPIIMLTGPIPATQALLARSGLTVDDIDLFEVNEAFASVVIAWSRELKPGMERVNVNGGAIALGHPVGATGARLTATLLHEMRRRQVELGIVTMCCGGGLGTGTLVQLLEQ